MIAKKIDRLVFIGGRMGREASLGKPLRKKFKEEDTITSYRYNC
ncbi:hypothetical protein Q5M85_06205 [Paraclostridium bifermentans]|nr:hypothetical protein [Paraclostridium bifermentans]